MGKEWAGLLFPRGKNGPAHSFPGKKLTGGKFWPVTPVLMVVIIIWSTVEHCRGNSVQNLPFTKDRSFVGVASELVQLRADSSTLTPRLCAIVGHG